MAVIQANGRLIAQDSGREGRDRGRSRGLPPARPPARPPPPPPRGRLGSSALLGVFSSRSPPASSRRAVPCPARPGADTTAVMPAVSKGDGMRGLAVFISDIRNCESAAGGPWREGERGIEGLGDYRARGIESHFGRRGRG